MEVPAPVPEMVNAPPMKWIMATWAASAMMARPIEPINNVPKKTELTVCECSSSADTLTDLT